jgi:TIR domain
VPGPIAAAICMAVWDVFISYKQTHSSKDYARFLVQILRGIGLNPWIDKQQMTRANAAYMPEKMPQGIGSSRVFLILGTYDYVSSLHVDASPCRREVSASCVLTGWSNQ